MPSFTANPSTHPFHGAFGCNGINHRDVGVAGSCDACGATVFQAEKGQLTQPGRNAKGAEVFQCWLTHQCNPDGVARRGLRDAEKLVSGRFPKGTEVEVFKGRKVPVGTVGTVRWIGENEYNRGTHRLGLKVEGQQKLVYVDAGNCRVPDEILAAAQAIVDHSQATGARLADLEEELSGLVDVSSELLAGLPAGSLTDEQNALFERHLNRRCEIRAEIDQIKEERGY